LFKYAQIDETGRCIGVSFLSGEVEADNMKPLTDDENVNPGDTWDGTTWTPAPIPDPVPPGESDTDKIAKLEQQLAQTNSDLAALMEAVYLAPTP
jgi:hypothetical protein